MSVIYLTFGQCFNQSITNSIPSSVIYLTFGYYFNKSIKNSIPSSVTHLTFGYYFNQPIENSIPPSVTHLTFGQSFNKSIANSIPHLITHLTFGTDFNQPLRDCGICQKHHLSLKNQGIPSNVMNLTFNQNPKGGYYFGLYLDFYPDKNIGYCFNQPIKNYIPKTVTNLTLPKRYKCYANKYSGTKINYL